MYARRVAVIKYGDVPCVAAYHAYLLGGERGARTGHHVFDARLMHAQHIGVTLDEYAVVKARYLVFGEIYSVQSLALVVNFRFGRVDVLGFGFVAAQYASAKSDDLAGEVMNWEDDTALVAVVVALFVLAAEPNLDQQVLVVAVFDGEFGEGRAAAGAVAQLEAVDYGVTETTLAEVGEADRLTLVGGHHGVGKVFLGEAVDVEHALALVLRGHFLGSLLAFLNLDIVFLGEVTQGFRVGVMLVLHDETHRVACLAASEAFEDVAGRIDVERRCLLLVERAYADKVGTAFLEGHKLAHHVFNACCLDDFVYGLARYHIAQIRSPPMIITPETTRSMRQKPMMSLALSLAMASAGRAQKG